MSEYMWNVTGLKPSLIQAKKMDRICCDEGGYGYTEVNRRRGAAPGINNGQYQGWFSGPNLGSPFDEYLRSRVEERLRQEEERP